MSSPTAALVDQWCDFSVLCSAHRLYISCSLVITHGSVTGWPNWISAFGTWNVIALLFDQPSPRQTGELIPRTRRRDIRTMPGDLPSPSKPCFCCNCAVSSIRNAVSLLTNGEPLTAIFQFSRTVVRVILHALWRFLPCWLYNLPARQYCTMFPHRTFINTRTPGPHLMRRLTTRFITYW